MKVLDPTVSQFTQYPDPQAAPAPVDPSAGYDQLAQAAAARMRALVAAQYGGGQASPFDQSATMQAAYKALMAMVSGGGSAPPPPPGAAAPPAAAPAAAGPAPYQPSQRADLTMYSGGHEFVDRSGAHAPGPTGGLGAGYWAYDPYDTAWRNDWVGNQIGGSTGPPGA